MITTYLTDPDDGGIPPTVIESALVAGLIMSAATGETTAALEKTIKTLYAERETERAVARAKPRPKGAPSCDEGA